MGIIEATAVAARTVVLLVAAVVTISCQDDPSRPVSDITPLILQGTLFSFLLELYDLSCALSGSPGEQCLSNFNLREMGTSLLLKT